MIADRIDANLHLQRAQRESLCAAVYLEGRALLGPQIAAPDAGFSADVGLSALGGASVRFR
jgi:hypothetical protein